jgi:hypothetical protein
MPAGVLASEHSRPALTTCPQISLKKQDQTLTDWVLGHFNYLGRLRVARFH